MKKNIILIAMGLVAIVVFSQSNSRRNVVPVKMDNISYDESGCYDGGVIRGVATTSIDKLTTEGVLPTNFGAEAKCRPSRTALMTGHSAVRTGNAATN